MSESVINAKRFLEDSKLLFKENSTGHATSLAILGFEEAHKAYLLIQLLPVMDAYIPPRQKKDVRRQLDKHIYKLKMAIGYQVFFEYLAYENGSDAQKQKIKETLMKMKELHDTREDLKKQTLELYFNTQKNKGFYVNPFASDSVWTPSKMTSDEHEIAYQVLELHISLVQDIVEFYMNPNLLLPDEIDNNMKRISKALGNARQGGLPALRKELDRTGEAGENLRGFLHFLEEFYDLKRTAEARRKTR